MFCEKEIFLLFAKIQVFSKVRNQNKLKFLQNYPDRGKHVHTHVLAQKAELPEAPLTVMQLILAFFQVSHPMT